MDEPITLTRGECIAIALVLQTREKKGLPEIEAALASVEKKLAPMTVDMWNKAFDDMLKATRSETEQAKTP
jgi:hypothetical protein